MTTAESKIVGLDHAKIVDELIVNSPLRDYDERSKDDYDVLPPLGVAYLLTTLGIEGFNVGLLDAEHFGISVRNIVRTIKAVKPKRVGLNVLTPTREVALSIARQLPDDIVLDIGGPHATALPDRTIREFSNAHSKTVLLAGHADQSIVQVNKGEDIHSVGGAYWVDDMGMVQQSLALPHPRKFSDMPHINREYLANDPTVDAKTGLIEARILTSLNCPFDCSFCAGARTSSKLETQQRNPVDVVDEIQHLIARYGIQSIRYIDDLFLASEKRVLEILREIEKRGLPTLSWDSTGRANILARFSSKAVEELAARGMHECAIGIESGSERLRKEINKRVTLSEIERSIDLLTKIGIKVKGYFIVGLPGETKAETHETLNMAKSLVKKYKGLFRASVFTFRPYPATQEWDKLIKKGWSIDELLEMHAEGKGERSKHSVTASHQFSEYEPAKLANMVEQYYEWQHKFLE